MISFNLMKYGIKTEIKNKISNNSDSYTFFNSKSIYNQTSFKWEEKDKEFWLNGKLYDIVSIDYLGSIKCINDAQEKILFQKIDQKINDFFSNNPMGKKALQNSKTVFFPVYLPVKSISFPCCIEILTTNNFNKLNVKNEDIAQTIVTPPPRFI